MLNIEVYFLDVESQTNHVLSNFTGAILQDDIIAKFPFQRLGSYWQRLRKSLQTSMDRLCRLSTSVQNQKHKMQKNIIENIFVETADY